jgi:hypothetical protein
VSVPSLFDVGSCHCGLYRYIGDETTDIWIWIWTIKLHIIYSQGVRNNIIVAEKISHHKASSTLNPNWNNSPPIKIASYRKSRSNLHQKVLLFS